MEEISIEKKGLSISSIVTALSILAPAAYLIGLSFYQGTLSAYGLDYESFPISGPDVYVTAYYAFGHFLLAIGTSLAGPFKSVFSPPSVYWFALIFVAFLFLTCWVRKEPVSNGRPWIAKIWQVITRFANFLHWKKNACTRAIVYAVVSSYIAVFILILIPMLAVLWWIFPLAAFHKAQKLENDKIAEFHKNGCYVKTEQPWSNCFRLYDADGKEMVSGLLVAMGDKRAAFFLKDGSVVLEMPEGYRIGRLYNEPKSGNAPAKPKP